MIYKTIPANFRPCKDGTFTTSKKHNACSWHGGLAKQQGPIKTIIESKCNPGKVVANKYDGIVLIPIEQVNIDTKLFQNRLTDFSNRSTENIINAAKNGSFDWVEFDPITLWENPQNDKLYVLSGHSRTEAFKELCKMGVLANGKDFCQIPAKVKRTNLEEARRIALESNTKSTKETDLERAIYYRQMRENKAPKEVVQKAKELEGKNANKILALSYLNPNGKMFQTLLQFEKMGDTDSKVISEKAARWIGNIRKIIPDLSNLHENEMYLWLFEQRAINRLQNEMAFRDRIKSLVNRHTFMGEVSKDFGNTPLNIQDNITKSPAEQQYDAQVEEAKQKVKELEKEIQDKIKEYTKRGATKQQLTSITERLNQALNLAKINLQKLALKKNEVKEAAKNEISLFGSINGLNRFKVI